MKLCSVCSSSVLLSNYVFFCSHGSHITLVKFSSKMFSFLFLPMSCSHIAFRNVPGTAESKSPRQNGIVANISTTVLIRTFSSSFPGRVTTGGHVHALSEAKLPKRSTVMSLTLLKAQGLGDLGIRKHLCC